MGRCLFIATGIAVGLMLSSSVTKAETLRSTIAHTIDTNPVVLISMHKLRSSEERIVMERSNYLPKLGVSGEVGWLRQNGSGSTTDHTSEASFSIQQMVFDGFRTNNRVEGALMSSQSSLLMMHARAEDIALRVVEVYLKVVRSEQLVELARGNLAIHNEIYEQVEQRVNNGLARSSDLGQIRSRRARANGNLVTAINTLSNSRSEFYSIVNRKPVDLVMPTVSSTILPASLEEALSLAKQDNPGLQAAGFDIKNFEAQAEETKSSFLPQLDLEVGQTWSDIPSTNGKTDALSAVLNFSYNIYNGGADQARRKEAAWRVEEAKATRELSYRNITRDLRLAWDAFIFLNGHIQYLEEHIISSQDVARVYQQQLQLGKRSLLDLLDTENELYQSQREFIQTVHEEVFARYRILHSIGQLLDSMSVEVPLAMRAETGFRSSLRAILPLSQ